MRLPVWALYSFFACLFFLGAWGGLTHFQRVPGGIGEFPVTPGEELGIYVSGQTPKVEKILEAARDGAIFSPLEHLLAGFSGSSHIHAWIRLPLTNPADEERTYVLQVTYPWINLATLYAPDGAGGYRVQEQGKVRHYSAAKSDPLAPAFAFTLAPRESQILLLKLQDSHWLQPSLALWEDPDQFHQYSLAVNRFTHVYLGLMGGLFLANLCALIAFRYRDLVYYLLFLAASSAVHCSYFNLFTVYRPDWIRADFFLMDPVFDFARFDGLLLITGGLLLLFTNEFLRLRQWARRTELFVVVTAGVLLTLGPLVMFGPLSLAGYTIRAPVAFLWSGSNFIAILIGIIALARRVRQARFFVPALLLPFVVSMRYVWSMLTYEVVGTEVFQQWVYASSLEMIVFSIALLDRFLVIVREKEEAQALAVEEARRRADLQQRFNRELMDTVDKQTRDLNNMLRQKDRLLAYLAHDMRTPLNSLVGLSSMLARSPAKISREEVRDYATEIEGSARGVSELMENLLSWARLQTGNFELQKQEYLVSDLFEASLPAVQTQARLKDVQVHLEPLSNTFVYCDFLAVTTVLRNLLSNAIRFSPAESAVTASAKEREDRIEISVTDQGPGLHEGHAERIRSKSPINGTTDRNGNGTGLGLSICHDLLDLHGSRLEVASKPNAGARFSFSLPKG